MFAGGAQRHQAHSDIICHNQLWEVLGWIPTPRVMAALQSLPGRYHLRRNGTKGVQNGVSRTRCESSSLTQLCAPEGVALAVSPRCAALCPGSAGTSSGISPAAPPRRQDHGQCREARSPRNHLRGLARPWRTSASLRNLIFSEGVGFSDLSVLFWLRPLSRVLTGLRLILISAPLIG